MEKYEAYEFFCTLASPGNLEVPEYTDLDLWAEFFRQLRLYDMLAPLSICISMLCFDMLECLPDIPYRRFYFELGIQAMDAEKEYIFDGAVKAGLVERGIVDIVNFAVGGTMPDNAEGLRLAIYHLFEEQTNMLKFLNADQFRAAHQFAYQRRE